MTNNNAVEILAISLSLMATPVKLLWVRPGQWPINDDGRMIAQTSGGYFTALASYSNVLASLVGSPSSFLSWFLGFFELLNSRTQIGALEVFRKNDRQHDGHYTVNVINIHDFLLVRNCGLGLVNAPYVGWAAYKNLKELLNMHAILFYRLLVWARLEPLIPSGPFIKFRPQYTAAFSRTREMLLSIKTFVVTYVHAVLSHLSYRGGLA